MSANYDFRVNLAKDASFTRGLRSFFEYRDLGIADATRGDYLAQVIRASRAVPRGSSEGTGEHHHDVGFQLVYVLKGWVTFQYDGKGEFTFRPGDSVLQPSGLRHNLVACSDDLELLEIVAPADFGTVEHRSSDE
jgi:mannose-6-phosphate isomerase-like protein (cupin superfamily)